MENKQKKKFTVLSTSHGQKKSFSIFFSARNCFVIYSTIVIDNQKIRILNILQNDHMRVQTLVVLVKMVVVTNQSTIIKKKYCIATYHCEKKLIDTYTHKLWMKYIWISKKIKSKKNTLYIWWWWWWWRQRLPVQSLYNIKCILLLLLL